MPLTPMSRTPSEEMSFARIVTTPKVQSGPNSRAVSTVFKGAVHLLQMRTTKDGFFVSDEPVFWIYQLTNLLFQDNLRFAFNSCIFGTANTTDSISTPCSTSSVCGPLQNAIGDGMGTPTTSGQYSYCTAYDNSFMGGSLDTCRDCLRINNDANYLSNCMTLYYMFLASGI